MKMTDLSILCKWENLKNWPCIKYLFLLCPTCIYMCAYGQKLNHIEMNIEKFLLPNEHWQE